MGGADNGDRRFVPGVSVRAIVATWQFWICLAFVVVAVGYGLGVKEIHDRIGALDKVAVTNCVRANDLRGSMRAVFAKFEAVVLVGQTDPRQRAATKRFFDTWLGPRGQRASHGPLSARNCKGEHFE